jgi:hypothetical protein
MRWALSLACAFAAWAFCGEEPFAWPKEVYCRGIERSHEWLEAAWRKHGPRLVKAGGKFYHLDEPPFSIDPHGIGKRDPRVRGKVTALLDTGSVEAITDAKALVQAQPEGGPVSIGTRVVLTTRTTHVYNRPGYIGSTSACFASPIESDGLSRAEFAEALRRGTRLWEPGRCIVCRGSRWATSPLGSRCKCEECNATGRGFAEVP